MEKLKREKAKHDHSLTDLLKVFVFALMVLLPFICFMPNAFYYGFNEQANAQEVTKEEPTYYQTNEVTTYTDLIIGNIYHYSDNMTALSNHTSYDYLFSIRNTPTLRTLGVTDEATDIKFYIGSTGQTTLQYYQNGGYLFNNVLNKPFDFVIDAYLNEFSATELIIQYLEESNIKLQNGTQEVTYTMSISDSMSVAWQSTWETPLFAWTNNTPFNTPINSFVNVFGITQESYISNYLIYIVIITTVYIVFDIVITVFKWLTHMINEK